jgi:hypothetical protein
MRAQAKYAGLEAILAGISAAEMTKTPVFATTGLIRRAFTPA